MSGIIEFFKSLIGIEKNDRVLIGLSSLNHSAVEEVYEIKNQGKKEPSLTELLRRNPY